MLLQTLIQGHLSAHSPASKLLGRRTTDLPSLTSSGSNTMLEKASSSVASASSGLPSTPLFSSCSMLAVTCRPRAPRALPQGLFQSGPH